MTLVVDASVALKWFVAEADTTAAARLLDGAESLIAPDLIVAELCNATWRLWRRGEATNEQVETISTRAAHLFDECVPLDGLAPKATEIARALDHPAHDCFYLALAELREARVVTADRRLIERLRSSAWEAHAVPLDALADRP